MAALQFVEVARALEEMGDAGQQRNLRLQQLMARALMERCAPNELETLLRVLMPSEERARVYGFKTPGLIGVLARALDLADRPDLGARVRRWRPMPADSLLTKHTTVVSLPEVHLAVEAARTFRASERRLTLAEVSALCDGLSEARGDAAKQSVLLADKVLKEGRMEDREWRLLLRVLLRTVSVGVGPQTVLMGVPKLVAAPAFFARRRSLKALADEATSAGEQATPSLQCGVPFVPMNGDALAAPYLLPWIFSREEKLAKPITPFDGRLVIITDRRGTVPQERWYTPLNNTYKLRMVSVEEDRVLSVKSRTRHMLLLRAFKEAKLLGVADGLVIHYTLSDEADGLVVMLLRAVTNALDAGVELSGTHDDAPPAREEDAALPDLETLIAKPMANDPKQSTITFRALGRQRGGHRLQVQVAERSEVPRRKRRQTNQNAAASSPGSRAAAAAEEEEEDEEDDIGVRNTRGSRQAQRRRKRKKRSDAYLMAQLKLDGDRLQAHVMDDEAGGATLVRLFTRNGYDVSDLYSDVCDELRLARLNGPCILDGELIVVNAAGLPLPWDSAKWRFNGYYARADAEETDAASSPETVVMMPDWGEARANCHNANDENGEEAATNDGPSFVPRNSRWAMRQPEEGARLRRVPVECHLRYVVFDLLMWNGEDLSATSCRLRHTRLMEALTRPLRRTRFVSVIQVP